MRKVLARSPGEQAFRLRQEGWICKAVPTYDCNRKLRGAAEAQWSCAMLAWCAAAACHAWSACGLRVTASQCLPTSLPCIAAPIPLQKRIQRDCARVHIAINGCSWARRYQTALSNVLRLHKQEFNGRQIAAQENGARRACTA